VGANFALDQLSRYEATLWCQVANSYFRETPWIVVDRRRKRTDLVSTVGMSLTSTNVPTSRIATSVCLITIARYQRVIVRPQSG
jgi:hypothetical protein